LALPALLSERGLSSRDAGLATELSYGTVRALGTLDDIIGQCSSRPVADLDRPVLDILRLGTYQLLRTRIPSHAGVYASVELARTTGNERAAGLVNAVLRKVARRDWYAWIAAISAERGPLARLAAQYAHPEWIAAAFADALSAGPEDAELELALAADDARPQTHLVARPGAISRTELLALAGPNATAGPYSPYAVRLGGGDPGALEPIRTGRAGVQDEGSQLCAIALANVDTGGRDERWLDLCAGPGGKAALLAALAAGRGAHLRANELREHRAALVRQATARWNVEVTVGDGVAVEPIAGGYDRIIVDAPCTGLGALRRRPEARWRRDPSDLAELTDLQLRLLGHAVTLLRPGGVVAYVTCSPHRAETGGVVERLTEAGQVDLIDARPYFPGVDKLDQTPTVQLWPHRQGTDAMFCALLRRR
jgi:16S rRNA (cytosine967-C5)-methyltransferase